MRPALFLTLGGLASALSGNTLAFGSIDPFNTEAMAPLPPRLALPADEQFVPCQAPQSNSTYGVIEVVDLALCQNPRTHELWASARSQAALVGVAQAPYLPGLSGQASTSRTITNDVGTRLNSASLTLSWLLLDFGTRSASLESARQLLSAASSTLDATVQTVFLSALQSYYNTQAARAAVVAALESEKASRESLTAAETRYTVGTGTPADRLQAQTAWSQAVLNRIRAEGTLKTAYGTLANVMGLNANQPLRLDDLAEARPDASFERDIEALIAEARERRPDLIAAEAQVRVARANVDVARGAGLPTLSLGAGPTWQGTTSSGSTFTTHGNAIGLTLSAPLFSGFDTTYRVRSAQAKVDVASAQRDNIRLQVALDVWTAYQSLITATQSIRTATDLVASAEASERVALGRYKAGVGTIIDVLNAQSALASARVQRIQAALDWHVSRAALAKAVGTLDGRLLNPAADSTRP
ncbi:MAG: TolC family protein [Betaproteobacteria bacterium]